MSGNDERKIYRFPLFFYYEMKKYQLRRLAKISNPGRTYFSRWKIEEYFRCKKQMFQFENFRVRKLRAINAIDFYITLCMAFLAMLSMKSEINALKVSIIKVANPIKEKMFFCITDWQKVSLPYFLMQKKVSDFGLGRSVQNTVNSALS